MTRFQSLGRLSRRAASQTVPWSGVTAGVDLGWLGGPGGVGEWDAWETQPSIRKVTSFIASNVASIPLHVYERAGDTDRPRVVDGPLAGLIGDPARVRGMSPMRFWERVILDGLLHDRWAVMVVPDDEPYLVRVPPRRFTLVTDELDRVQAVRVYADDGTSRDLDPAGFLLDVGYSSHSGQGTSPIQTLRSLLDEARESMAYRRQVMAQAARHSGIVLREQPWSSKAARDNFLESLRAFMGDGGRAGGAMLLDEGMKWEERAFKPTDLGDLEARRLTDVEVASAYHIAPEILGVRAGTYSNMATFRQTLYRDNLGPYIDAWEQAVAPLAEIIEPGRGLYIEANVAKKLRGSFEEQAQVLQSSTGAPWLTRNEARARQNLPAVEGGDELVTPLNVLVGGQASPRDSGSQNVDAAASSPPDPPKSAPRVLVKSADLEQGWTVKAEGVLRAHFERQGRSVLRALGAKSPAWWDGERWDRELAADLYALAATCVEQMGREATEALGFDPDEGWDQGRVLAYLRAVTKARAKWVNDATLRRIEAALAEGDADGAAKVFEDAKAQRAGAGAGAFIAAMAGFAVVEAGKQNAPGLTVKTWVTGRNPRPSHAAMNGVAVRSGEDFPNGMSWPGDPSGGVDEVAGCNCSVALSSGVGGA